MSTEDSNILLRTVLLLCLTVMSVCGVNAQIAVVYKIDGHPLREGLKTEFKEINSLIRYLEKMEREERAKGYLTFSVDSVFDSGLDSRVLLHRGRLFSMDRSSKRMALELDSDMDRLEDEGFPFARILVETALDSGEVMSRATIDTGPLITMDSVVYLEGDELPQVLISKHIGLKSGDPYSETRIRAMDRKLKALPFIRIVRPSAVIFAGEQARAILALEKRNANRVDGILGFQPDQDGKARFTGDVKLDLQNALSHLDNLYLNWQRVADNSQKLDFGLRLPYLFRTSIGVEASISQFRQDTTFNEVELEGGLFSVLDGGGALKVFFASKVVNDLLTADDVQKEGTSTFQYGLSYKLDLRDDPVNPRSGLRSDIRFSYGDKDLSTALGGAVEQKTVGQWSAYADLRSFIPLWKNSVIVTRLNGFHLESESVIRNELERVGGLTTLRGHDEQSIRASSYLIGTLEYRFLTGERSYINAFSDYGYVATVTTDENGEDRAYGFGIGAALDTGAGILSLSYALGSRSDLPVVLSTGKVHLGYTAVF